MTLFFVLFAILVPSTFASGMDFGLTYSASASQLGEEDLKTGSSVRTRFTTLNNSGGVGAAGFLIVQHQGLLPAAGVGLGFRTTSGSMYFDLTGGITLGLLALNPVLFPAIGFKISNSTSISLPIIFLPNLGFLSKAHYTPHLTFHF